MKPPSRHYNLQSVRAGSVSFQRASSNRKLTSVDFEVYDPKSRFKRPVPKAPFCATTYASIEATCPSTCRFKHHGCYVQSGITGARARKLDEAAHGMSADKVIEHEAEVIDQQWPRGVPQDGARGGRDLRLHVGGDVSSPHGARVLAYAAMRYRMRGGGAVWTYTHRWAEIPREAWGCIRVLASVESLEEAEEALSLGYVPAFTMAYFASERAWRPKHSHMRIIPCPAQTRDRNCVSCRLCLDTPLKGPVAIGFAMHGVRAKGERRRLPIMWEQLDARMDYTEEMLDGARESMKQAQAAVAEACAAAKKR